MSLEKLPTKMSAGLGLSMIDRSVKELHASRCTMPELDQIRQYFAANGGLICIYCQSDKPNRWDHLHPVSRGGDTVPGNLVPACGRCDDSKQDREVEEWVKGKSPHRPAAEQLPRILTAINAYRVRFNYLPIPFDQKLTSTQLATYRAFQLELQALRKHLQTAGLLK